jgi:hypothetical protein
MDEEKLSLLEAHALKKYFEIDDVRKSIVVMSDYPKIIERLKKVIARLTGASIINDEFKCERLDKLNRDAEDSLAEEDDDEYEQGLANEYTQSMDSIVQKKKRWINAMERRINEKALMLPVKYYIRQEKDKILDVFNKAIEVAKSEHKVTKIVIYYCGHGDHRGNWVCYPYKEEGLALNSDNVNAETILNLFDH